MCHLYAALTQDCTCDWSVGNLHALEADYAATLWFEFRPALFPRVRMVVNWHATSRLFKIYTCSVGGTVKPAKTHNFFLANWPVEDREK